MLTLVFWLRNKIFNFWYMARQSNFNWFACFSDIKNIRAQNTFNNIYNTIWVTNTIYINLYWKILKDINQILHKLKRAKWFGIIDLKSDYWQYIVEKDSVEITAFRTRTRHYECLRLYIYSETFDQHFKQIETVLEILRNTI